MLISIVGFKARVRGVVAELVGGCDVFAIGLAILCAVAVLPAQDSAAQRQDSAPPPTAGPQEYEVIPESSTPAAAKREPAMVQEEEFISPDDHLDIFVMDVPELSRQYRVTASGLIDVPLLKDPIMAAGLTPEQLAHTIRDKLQAAGMVNDPHVTMQVVNSRAHSVTIAGAVKNPQIFPVPSKTTLLDAISQAGGLAPEASNTAIVARGDLGSRLLGLDKGSPGATDGGSAAARTVKIDLKRLMEDGDPALNLTLYPGDRVTVQRAGVVYVVGAVNRAGGFALAQEGDQMTVLRAIALADNIKSTAQPKKTVIIRKDPNAPDGAQQIPLNLNKILEGHEPDQRLLANDILFVPDSARKKALHRAGEAAAQAASIMVYRIP